MDVRIVESNRVRGIVNERFESSPTIGGGLTVVTMFVWQFMEPEIAGERRADVLHRCGEFIDELLTITSMREYMELEVMAYFEEVPGSWAAFESYAGPRFRRYANIRCFRRYLGLARVAVPE